MRKVDREAWTYVVALCIIACVASYCGEADANPVTLHFRNPGVAGDPTYQAIVTAIPGVAPVTRTVTCPPGMECLITVPLLPGAYPDVRLKAQANGLESVPSNSLPKTVVPPTACDFDYDHDGVLLGIDFKMWIADYQQGYWTGQDFATFSSRFGKSCAAP